MMPFTYLDYNATALTRPEIIELTSQVMQQPHNASAVHNTGREGRKLIENARRYIANLTGADSNNVIFNSGATEGNNTVLKHFGNKEMLISSIEHPAVFEVLPHAKKIPVDDQGLVDLNKLDSLMESQKPTLVSVMLVNNETGVIQPMADISKIVRKHGAYLHCDGVQAAGRVPINMIELGIDFLTLSAHKIGGPQGVGALVLGLCGETPTLLDGGGQEKKARAGTENVAGIAGFGLAAEMALQNLDTEPKRLQILRDHLEKRLHTLNSDILIHSAKAPRVTNTSMFSIPGATSETLMMALDLDGIAVSNGSACSSGTVKSSHVLQAMHLNNDLATSALRVSLGWNSTMEDVDRFLEIFEKILGRLQN